jgi:hypothetical protein
MVHHDSNLPGAQLVRVADLVVRQTTSNVAIIDTILIISNHTHLASRSQRLNLERLDKAEPWPQLRRMQVQSGLCKGPDHRFPVRQHDYWLADPIWHYL